MRQDERLLLNELRRRNEAADGATPSDVASELGMHPKRCLSLCQEWWGRRWLEQSSDRRRGFNFTTGRLTAAGLHAPVETE